MSPACTWLVQRYRSSARQRPVRAAHDSLVNRGGVISHVINSREWRSRESSFHCDIIGNHNIFPLTLPQWRVKDWGEKTSAPASPECHYSPNLSSYISLHLILSQSLFFSIPFSQSLLSSFPQSLIFTPSPLCLSVQNPLRMH